MKHSNVKIELNSHLFVKIFFVFLGVFVAYTIFSNTLEKLGYFISFDNGHFFAYADDGGDDDGGGDSGDDDSGSDGDAGGDSGSNDGDAGGDAGGDSADSGSSDGDAGGDAGGDTGSNDGDAGGDAGGDDGSGDGDAGGDAGGDTGSNDGDAGGDAGGDDSDDQDGDDGDTPDVVVVHTPKNPTCDAFTATPSARAEGGQVTLAWETTDATNVSINQGIGSVSADGSQVVIVNNDITYTLTASNAHETITCQTSVDITPVTNELKPICDAFSVSPNSMSGSGSATLSWNTTNATEISIDNGIGNVAEDGTRNVDVSNDTTYTLTAKRGNDTVTCQTSVDITDGGGGGGGGGGGSSSPRCELTASDRKITFGERVTLSWKNVRTNDIILKDNRGNVIANSKKDSSIDEDKDSVRVSPSRDTTYTLTAKRGSRERTCRVTIEVEGVTLSSNRIVDGISLTQVPYTGFEAGPVLTAIFYIAIVLWGLAIAYALVMKNKTVPALPQFVQPVQAAPIVAQAAAADPVSFAPFNLPMSESVETEIPPAEDTLRMLEEHAHGKSALISSDALRFIEAQGGTAEEQIQTLDRIIALAKARYPKENEWIVINKERVLSLIA